MEAMVSPFYASIMACRLFLDTQDGNSLIDSVVGAARCFGFCYTPRRGGDPRCLAVRGVPQPPEARRLSLFVNSCLFISSFVPVSSAPFPLQSDLALGHAFVEHT